MMGMAVIAIVVIAGMFIFANNSTLGSIDYLFGGAIFAAVIAAIVVLRRK